MSLINKIRAFLNEEETTSEVKEKKAVSKKQKKSYDSEFFDDEELGSVRANQTAQNERKAVMDFCEQLIDVSGHMAELDKEYKIVTGYLTDIQKIEELPIEYANKLNTIAENVVSMDDKKKLYAQSEKLLSEEQFNIIEAHEDEVVQTINRLEEMEARDMLLRNDMGHLEGEKEDLTFLRGEYNKGVSVVRSIMGVTLALFFVVIAVLAYIAFVSRKDVMVYALVAGAIAMVLFAMAYIKYVDFRKDIKDSDAKYKRAVSLLNKVKVKYINNTNAVDYIYNKYGVNSSKELMFFWESYNTMIRDSKRFSRANNELLQLSDQLVEMLDKIGIKDSEIWIKQASSLVNREELTSIKEGLLDRRNKLRERIIICHKINENAKTALRAAIASNAGLELLINETLEPHNININASV